jgi:hypothetical protein
MQVSERAGVEIVPTGVPAWLTGGKLGRKFLSAEVVAQAGNVGQQRDLIAADRILQPMAIGVRIYI